MSPASFPNETSAVKVKFITIDTSPRTSKFSRDDDWLQNAEGNRGIVKLKLGNVITKKANATENKVMAVTSLLTRMRKIGKGDIALSDEWLVHA